ncbi:MAG: hypothetical protein RL693_1893, partial [Verrucomicrobiota bacterium]
MRAKNPTKRVSRKKSASLADKPSALDFVRLEDRILYSATPTVTVSAPDVNIGEDVSIQVTFDNTHPTDTGFGPYIDVMLPRNGADGAAGTDTPDGIGAPDGAGTGTGLVTANYLGAALAATSDYTFTDNDGGDATTGTFTHPFAKDALGNAITVTGTVGDRLLVYQLPFGSFAPDQPAAVVNINAQSSDYADLGTPLAIRVNGGFMYGNDPLDNPIADNPIFQSSYSNPNAWVTDTVTPQLFTLHKTFNGPEGETATGPNFLRTYTVTLDVALGQTLSDIDVTDALPTNAQFVSVTGITDGGTLNGLLTTANTLTPVGNIAVNFGSVSDGSASFDINFYVPLHDASTANVINPTTGDDVAVNNNVEALGDWTPLDPRDLGGTDNAHAGSILPPHE